MHVPALRINSPYPPALTAPLYDNLPQWPWQAEEFDPPYDAGGTRTHGAAWADKLQPTVALSVAAADCDTLARGGCGGLWVPHRVRWRSAIIEPPKRAGP